jgi:drug/metabolite transporter (DMT)-like permease
MIPAKGLYQTRLQWTLLAILTFSMSTYMIIASGKKEDKSASSDMNTLIIGTIFAFLKVIISCVGAVISDKYMKEFKSDPTHVCIARTFVARAVAIVLLSFTQDTWVKGFFSGWNAMTIGVTASFIIKSVSTLYIVALLDSILKNIAEAFSVLVIYAFDVLAMGKPFEIASFLSVLVVVAACAAYVDSKTPIDKAKKWDKMQDDKAKASAVGA